MRYVRTAPHRSSDDYLVVTLEELRHQLRIDHSDEDDALKVFLRAAIASVDGPGTPMNRIFVPGTFQAISDSARRGDCLVLDTDPIREITEVACKVGGAYQPIDGWSWSTHSDGGAPRVVVNVPAGCADHGAGDWRVTFAGGPATADDLPPEVRMAILLRASFLFGNRGESNPGPEPRAVEDLLAPYYRRRC